MEVRRILGKILAILCVLTLVVSSFSTVLAATFEEVIPHLLKPVPTNTLGIKSENSPIYGILSKLIQSSVFHLYKTSQLG